MTEHTGAPPDIAENTHMARGEYAAFFERNKGGIQYVDVETKTYYISREWTLRGPIPRGAKVEHTGLASKRQRQQQRKRGLKK